MKKLTQYYLALFSLFAEGGILDIGYNHPERKVAATPEEVEALKKEAQERKIQRMLKKGANAYFYGKDVVFARSQEAADKKAARRGYKRGPGRPRKPRLSHER